MSVKSRRVIAISLFIVAGAVIVGGILSFILLSLGSSSSHTNPIEDNIIMRENANQGTNNWQIPANDVASTEIQAYANLTSVSPGQKIIFYVSTEEQSTLYNIDIYRLGWYSGLGGRQMLEQTGLSGQAQGYYNPHTHTLENCTSCLVDKNIGLIEARWKPSFPLTIPSDWVTGVYLAKFTDSHNKQTDVPFDVLGNPHSQYVVATGETTSEAYNDWGGYSLYVSYSKKLVRAVKVSFDRPYHGEAGSANTLIFNADTIRWFERQGYDLSYISSLDLHENPDLLLMHRAFISLGHDEYWTKEMRDGVEYARDHGVGLAFLGANAVYWQMRFEPNSTGDPDRTVVCYKVDIALHDLARDPYYGKDNTRVTARWRDPVLHLPENALVGIMSSGVVPIEHGFPWRVSPQATSPLLNGTGLQPGQQYGCVLVGYEWDRIFQNGNTPPDLQIIGDSPTKGEENVTDTSNSAYYISASGAFVFASGSIYWGSALDDYRYSTIPFCTNQARIIPGIQKLMEHVMEDLVVLHPSHQLT